VSPVIDRKIKPVCFMVRRDDDAAAIWDVMLANMFFIDAQRIRRRGRVDFHMIVKCEAIDTAEIAGLADAQDHAFQKPIKAPEGLLGGNFLKIPKANGMADRLQKAILTHALGDSADHIVLWLAHRVQRPGEKINRALLLGGDVEWIVRDAGPRLAHNEGPGKGADQSRSGKAFRKGAALKAAGHSYEEMRNALLAGDDPEIADWARTKGLVSGEREIRRLYDNAHVSCGREGVTLEDFRAYMPMHSYIFTPCREMWPAASVNARVPPVPLVNKGGAPVLDSDGKQKKQRASSWLDKNRPVECMTWAPGEPMLIADRLIFGGGWVERDGVSCFNLYWPPLCRQGDPAQAGPWIEHAYRVFGAAVIGVLRS
jgi:hypothetical protein